MASLNLGTGTARGGRWETKTRYTYALVWVGLEGQGRECSQRRGLSI
jgi:hypothetical protein